MTQFTQNTVCDYDMECAWELCTPLYVLLIIDRPNLTDVFVKTCLEVQEVLAPLQDELDY